MIERTNTHQNVNCNPTVIGHTNVLTPKLSTSYDSSFLRKSMKDFPNHKNSESRETQKLVSSGIEKLEKKIIFNNSNTNNSSISSGHTSRQTSGQLSDHHKHLDDLEMEIEIEPELEKMIWTSGQPYFSNSNPGVNSALNNRMDGIMPPFSEYINITDDLVIISDEKRHMTPTNSKLLKKPKVFHTTYVNDTHTDDFRNQFGRIDRFESNQTFGQSPMPNDYGSSETSNNSVGSSSVTKGFTKSISTAFCDISSISSVISSLSNNSSLIQSNIPVTGHRKVSSASTQNTSNNATNARRPMNNGIQKRTENTGLNTSLNSTTKIKVTSATNSRNNSSGRGKK